MAGTVVCTKVEDGRFGRITCTATADASDGSFPATAIPNFSGYLLALRTNPGAVAPTANYDMTLVDMDGVDRLQGVGANRHTANSEVAAVVYSGTAIHPPVVNEVLTLTIINNSVNSAVTVVTLDYVR